jgi:hypothetical protein
MYNITLEITETWSEVLNMTEISQGKERRIGLAMTIS